MKNTIIQKTVLCLSVFIFSLSTSIAHPWKPREYVIIDTDGGIDDFRALNILLSSPAIRILGISCSNGVLSAEETHDKLLELLNATHQQGILTGVNNIPGSVAKNCQSAHDLIWGKPYEKQTKKMTHVEMINRILEQTHEEITFLNLGNLSTLSSCLDSIPDLKKHLHEALWMADYPNIKGSFNYLTDSMAYKKINSNDIPVYIINGEKSVPKYNLSIREPLDQIASIQATNISSSFQDVSDPFALTIYDEIGAIFLHYPELFVTDSVNQKLFNIHLTPNTDQKQIFDRIFTILKGETFNPNQVLAAFPADTLTYSEDIKPIVKKAIHDFGAEEWTACTMTMELHRHVGIYALMGAKMGIRAREYFGAGIDEMKITSYAGSTPPFSCLNDGLQVSTGATLGHGLITLAKDSVVAPKADFEYLGQKISVSLKDSFKKQIRREIQEAVKLYGLESDEYWDFVRKRTVYYWSHWDRSELFEIKKEDN